MTKQVDICRARNMHHQPYPKTGLLAKNLNPRLKNLRSKLASRDADVYCYVIRSVRNHDGYLEQQGCGPNWQGGLITLCTCKHYMRTFKDVNDWNGTWIAGFSGVKAGKGKNALVYLMMVKQAFESHYDLWHALKPMTRQAKAANRKGNIFGDVLRPRGKLSGKQIFSPNAYYHPCDSHVHLERNAWHRDVNYRGCIQRTAALVFGDKKLSFLWSKPVIQFKHDLGRGQKKCNVTELMKSLLIESRK